MHSLSYQSLDDFTGLPAVREAVARRDPGLHIIDLPAFNKDASIESLVGLQATNIMDYG